LGNKDGREGGREGEKERNMPMGKYEDGYTVFKYE